MNRGTSRIPVVLAALAVLVLVGVVAVAASGSTPSGTSDTRPPAELLLDTFFSLALLALVPAALLFVYGLMQRKAIQEEIASGRYPRTGILAFGVFMALFTGAAYLAREHGFSFGAWGDNGEIVEIGPDGSLIVRDASANDPDAYQAEFAWIPVLAVVGLAAVAAGAYLVASRRRRGPATEADVAVTLADVLEDTLDDLRAEPDPRRAVVAAFARLERGLGAAGLPRRPAETAEEYVTRILERLDVDRAPIRRLTDLFTAAKFSHHDVDESMRTDALNALVEIRDALREIARRQQESAVTPPGPQQAAPS